jgi:transcriptional regulator with XRE-family HTH domain
LGGISNNLGNIFKEARLQIGMTQQELAAKLHITARHLMSIENGWQKPSRKLLFRIVRELNIPGDWVFHPETVHDQQKFEQAMALLRQCNHKELDVVIATLCALLKDK